MSEQINAKVRVIDCDADPFVPDGWKVVEHIKGGQFEWNPTSVKLYLSESQKSGKSVNGNKLRKELEGQKVLNANVLCYLLYYRDIPDEWKGKKILFWGTIYRGAGGLYVLCLYCRRGEWTWGYYWLGSRWFWKNVDYYGFNDNDPAVVLASSESSLS